jgi:hypothetical protein
MFNVQCSRCPQLLTEEQEQCPRCGTEAWCKWDAAWYDSPLTKVSIGQHEGAKAGAKVFALASTVHILAIHYLASRGQLDHLQRSDMAGITLLLAFFTYEVWAYFHGWTTSIDRFFHEGKPSRTEWRTFGLGLDVLIYAVIALKAWRG